MFTGAGLHGSALHPRATGSGGEAGEEHDAAGVEEGGLSLRGDFPPGASLAGFQLPPSRAEPFGGVCRHGGGSWRPQEAWVEAVGSDGGVPSCGWYPPNAPVLVNTKHRYLRHRPRRSWRQAQSRRGDEPNHQEIRNRGTCTSHWIAIPRIPEQPEHMHRVWLASEAGRHVECGTCVSDGNAAANTVCGPHAISTTRGGLGKLARTDSD